MVSKRKIRTKSRASRLLFQGETRKRKVSFHVFTIIDKANKASVVASLQHDLQLVLVFQCLYLVQAPSTWNAANLYNHQNIAEMMLRLVGKDTIAYSLLSCGLLTLGEASTML